MTTSFRDAHDWATSATGVGVLEDEGELSWKNKVRKKFDHCYEIVDIMADRAGSVPKCTNDDPNNLDLDDDDGPDFAVDDDDDDDAEEEDADVVPPPSDADSVAVVPPPSAAAAAAAAAAAPPSSSKKDKKQRKRGGRATLMDDETMKAFALANDMSEKRFRE